MKFPLYFLALTALIPVSGARSETLTYQDLVHRLTDMEHLATRPPAGEQGALASSYDRSSTYDAATDTYHRWDANADGGGVIRREGDESVLAEIQGPGCIWRTWAATTSAGHVKIYLDGAETPTVDLPFTAYFDGTSAPFNRPNLVYKTAANGWNNYTPIPFLKSCRIVADKGWGSYYHFNYTRFAPGTVVPTFKLPLSADDNAALDAADKILGNPGVNPSAGLPGEETKKTDLTVPPGEKAVVADLSGSGAITALKVKFPMPTDPEAQKNLLRQLAISIVWDNEKESAVWAPLGDFYADALIPVKFRNLVTGISDDGQWYSYWYMPFSSHAQVRIENQSGAPLAMTWEVTHSTLAKTTADTLLRFHAKWHRDVFPVRPDRAPDWTLLKTEGTGRYVGTQLHLWNPRSGWWGEGDEKFFVDGEKFPSTYGTGSEDYFGFAWSSGKPFQQALHGQPASEDNHGHATLYRWHIADNIPFQTGFEGVIEKYFPNSRPTLFDAVAFWYLAPGGKDPFGAVPVADRIGYWATPPPVAPIPNVVVATTDPNDGPPDKDADRIEGESMRSIMGDAFPQAMQGHGQQWSGNAHLFWPTERLDAHCENEFQAPKAGRFRLVARFTQATDYGVVQISINGAKVGPPVDLHASAVKTTLPIELGVADIKEGANILGMDIVGPGKGGPKATKVGLDYIKLLPIP